LVLDARLGVEVFYSSAAAKVISEEYSTLKISVPKQISANAGIYDFMQTQCDFSCEHADGSFLDHLYFCHDYSAQHYRAHSPRVLLLHSILGVGTNIFPIKTEQIADLEALLTPFESRHISAFPSFLRLLTVGLVDAMRKLSQQDMSQLKHVHFHRVIDNMECSVTVEDFWIHLNYHVMHFLDFLPAAAWSLQLNDPLFQVFRELYDFLKQHDKCQCTINFDLTSPGEYAAGLPLTLGTLVARNVPMKLARTLGAKTIRKYSRECKHSLKCTFEFAEARRSIIVQ